jgi:hypothetical protein
MSFPDRGTLTMNTLIRPAEKLCPLQEQLTKYKALADEFPPLEQEIQVE